MELSSALSQRLSELQIWRQEAILTIRKAFTFEDVDCNIERPAPILDTGFVVGVREDGFGFLGEEDRIVAYPDARTHQIVVSKRLGGKATKTRINTFMTVYETNPNAEGRLRKEIVEFLALSALGTKPIDW